MKIVCVAYLSSSAATVASDAEEPEPSSDEEGALSTEGAGSPTKDVTGLSRRVGKMGIEQH